MKSFISSSVVPEDKLFSFYKSELLPRLSNERFDIDRISSYKVNEILEFDDDWKVLLYFIELRFGKIEDPIPLLDIGDLWSDLLGKEQKESRYIKLVEPLLILDFDKNRLIGALDQLKDKRDFTRYLKRMKRLHHLLQPLKESSSLPAADAEIIPASTLREKLFVFIEKCIFKLKDIFSLDRSIKNYQMIDDVFLIFEDFHVCHVSDSVKNTFYNDLKRYYDTCFSFLENEFCFYKSPNPDNGFLSWIYKLVDSRSKTSQTIKKFEQDREKLKESVLVKFRSALMQLKIKPQAGMQAYLDAYHFMQTSKQALSVAVWEYRKRCEKEWKQSRFISERQYLAQLENLDTELLKFDAGLKNIPEECFANMQKLTPSSMLESMHGILKHMHDPQIVELADAINWVHHTCYSANDTEKYFYHELNTFLKLNPANNLNGYSLTEAYTITDKLVDKLESIYNDTRYQFSLIIHPDKASDSVKDIATECFQYISGLYEQAKKFIDIWRGGQWSISKTLALSMNNSITTPNMDTLPEMVFVDEPQRDLDLSCLAFKDEYIKLIRSNIPLNKPPQSPGLSVDYQLYDGDENTEPSSFSDGSDRRLWENSRSILFYRHQAEFDRENNQNNLKEIEEIRAERIKLEEIIKDDQKKTEDSLREAQMWRNDVKQHELREKLSERLYLLDPSDNDDEIKSAVERIIHEVYRERIIRVFEISLDEVSEAAIDVMSTDDNLQFIIENRTKFQMI